MSFKSGFVTIIGVPNAGKSSLVNGLIKESVSIVTAKPQTTRKRTLGILTKDKEYQIVFTDTPGVIESDAGLNTYLRSELFGALKDVDVVVAAIAPWEFDKSEKPWVLEACEKIEAPTIYIATQIDKKMGAVTTSEGRAERWRQWVGDKVPLLETSSRTNEGLEELKNKILAELPEGPQYYDADLFTPQTMREMTAEAIRKQCFEMLHQEIPYGLAVIVTSFDEGEGESPSAPGIDHGIFNIGADIIIAKESHKGMVIGKGGAVLKQIGTRARFELERMFGKKIFLKLHVVVKPAWIKDKHYLSELGFVPEK